MWTPPSPEKEEVEEETCVEINVQDKKAIPFFTHDSGCIYIQGIFSTPFTILLLQFFKQNYNNFQKFQVVRLLMKTKWTKLTLSLKMERLFKWVLN